ncbi:MAG: hypothetical protein PHU94_04715 [Bacilli bacterium]|nr:hypothetical protein [Bacilli bacterium]MDD4733789.1 hypothetical protein [Bacilli bacterium]
MILETQFKLRQNPLYIKYLRENSYWYKILNRNPNAFIEFEKKIKEDIQTQKREKITRFIDYLNLFQGIVSSLK